MKIIIIFLSSILLSGCQTLHVTKQYYNEYVNPKASIDYDDVQSSDIPLNFLENYYKIDSKLISLCNQINMVESVMDTEWFDLFNLTYPWAKGIGFYDTEGMFISGSEAVGYDVDIRQLIVEKEEKRGNTFIFKNNRIFLLNTIETKLETYRFVVVEIDLSGLVDDAVLDGLDIVIGNQLVFGKDLVLAGSVFEKIFAKRNYSGKMTVDGKKLFWVRSYAADNLAYFFPG